MRHPYPPSTPLIPFPRHFCRGAAESAATLGLGLVDGLIKVTERRNEMNWKKLLEALYGFIGALLGAWAASGCSLMGSGVGMTMH